MRLGINEFVQLKMKKDLLWGASKCTLKVDNTL